jgi:Domain of unknown function (DUF4129)
MHKYFLITGMFLFSCTAHKKQETTELSIEAAPVDTPVKKYLYVDTPVENNNTSIYNSTETVVTAPAEEVAPQDVNDTMEIDTTVYRWQLSVSADTVNNWKNNKSFTYVSYLDSLLKAEKNKKKEEEKEYKPQERGTNWLAAIFSSGALQVFLWILAALFVLYILYKLFVTEGALKRNPKAIAADTPTAGEEVITAESDFDRLVREALQQRNYRLAVRYHYLHTLHILAEKKYIELANDKTNNDYIREVKDYSKQKDFSDLTLNYDYVWYGEFEIDEQVYQKLKTAFQAFNNKI